MADFDEALAVVLDHEGGYVNHPNDPGGPTNRGITQATLTAWRGKDATADDVAHLSTSETRDIYRARYWLPVYGRVADQTLGTKVFDMAVNMGHKQAHRIVQVACRGRCPGIAVDGDFGPETLAAVNSDDPARLLKEIKHQQAKFYICLADNQPKFEPFRKGWLDRAEWPKES